MLKLLYSKQRKIKNQMPQYKGCIWEGYSGYSGYFENYHRMMGPFLFEADRVVHM